MSAREARPGRVAVRSTGCGPVGWSARGPALRDRGRGEKWRKSCRSTHPFLLTAAGTPCGGVPPEHASRSYLIVSKEENRSILLKCKSHANDKVIADVALIPAKPG